MRPLAVLDYLDVLLADLGAVVVRDYPSRVEAPGGPYYLHWEHGLLHGPFGWLERHTAHQLADRLRPMILAAKV
jgi:hypothetical protein